jgi:hypothetical protein
MRRLLGVVSAISVLAAQPVLAGTQCTSPTDRSMFEVQSLRSELMVLATGCNYDEKYNAFIRRYQGDLQANERAVSSYFSHRYGRSGQYEHDRFVTDLANANSRLGTDLGGDFCPRNGLIFNEVLSLASTNQLADYAAGKDIIPASIDVCATPGAAATSKSSGKTSSKKK